MSAVIYSIGVPDPKTPYEDSKQHLWASTYVMDGFVNLMDTHSASNMLEKLRNGLASRKYDWFQDSFQASFQGRLFKCYTLHLFFTGGGLRLRKRRLYQASKKRRSLSV